MTRFDSTSWSLVLGAAAAVPRDREEFGRRYGPLVRSWFAARWRVAAEHERVADASQEVFLRMFSPDGPLTRVERDRDGGFRAYLRGVLRNVATELERHERRRQTSSLDSSIEPPSAADPTPSDAFDRVWAEMVTDAAWDLMRRKAGGDRWAHWRLEVLALRYGDDRSCQDIATQLGLETAQVYRLLAAGREQFRRALMTVLSAHHPDLLPDDLERKCREVLDAL